MIRLLTLFILGTVLSITAYAQSSAVSLSTGISYDVSNAGNYNFFHIPVSAEWSAPIIKENLWFLFKFTYSIPVGGEGADEAYTLNPALPGSVAVQKSIHSSLVLGSIGLRTYFKPNKKNGRFFIDFLPAGIYSQNFTVRYKNYDKTNYDIINPDVGTNISALAVALSVGYSIPVKSHNDLLIELNASTPLSFSRGLNDDGYDLSYKRAAPLQLTIGYNLNCGK
jgi:hypothetical protein